MLGVNANIINCFHNTYTYVQLTLFDAVQSFAKRDKRLGGSINRSNKLNILVHRVTTISDMGIILIWKNNH